MWSGESGETGQPTCEGSSLFSHKRAPDGCSPPLPTLLLSTLDDESFFEGFVIENHVDLLPQLCINSFAFAVVAAEANIGTSDADFGFWVQTTTAVGAFLLDSLASHHELVISFGDELFVVRHELGLAVSAAEVNFATVELDKLCFVDRSFGDDAHDLLLAFSASLSRSNVEKQSSSEQ